MKDWFETVPALEEQTIFDRADFCIKFLYTHGLISERDRTQARQILSNSAVPPPKPTDAA